MHRRLLGKVVFELVLKDGWELYMCTTVAEQESKMGK